MRLLALFRRLGPVDARNIRRDALLMWTPVLPFVVALLYRLGVPAVGGVLMDRLAFDLTPYHPLLMSAFVLTTASVVGMVVGFLLIDERDERTLTALLVSPVALGPYLAYRLTVPVALGFVMTLAAYPLTGLTPLSFVDLLAVAGLATLTAPVVALVLAAFSPNKVAAFAIVKLLNAVQILPVAAYFVDPPLQLAAGLVPTYWPFKVLWLAADGAPYAAYWLTGVVLHVAWIGWLLVRFNRVVRR